jgi:hypothetical protein
MKKNDKKGKKKLKLHPGWKMIPDGKKQQKMIGRRVIQQRLLVQYGMKMTQVSLKYNTNNTNSQIQRLHCRRSQDESRISFLSTYCCNHSHISFVRNIGRDAVA